MRIVILQGAFLPVPALLGGAVEKMWFALAKEFAQRGHQVIQVSRQYQGLPQTEQLDGVTHLRVPGYDTPKSGLLLKWRDLLYTLRVRQQLRVDADVVVTSTFWAPIMLPARIRKICLVDVQRMPKGQMWFYKHVARLRANSTPVTTAICNELPKSHYGKVMMIPNPLPFTTRAPLNIVQKKPVILYAGRIHPEKGLSLLIKAFKQTATNYRLQLVGPWAVEAGGGGAAYHDSLVQLAGDSPIDFIGPIYDSTILNDYYANAAIFVYPSIAERGETFGMAPLEAMAWGCVPIVSDLACFRDFIRNGENGLIFDHRSHEAVTQLTRCLSALQHRDLYRQQLARNAAGVRDSHSTAHIADLFLAEFARVQETTQPATYP